MNAYKFLILLKYLQKYNAKDSNNTQSEVFLLYYMCVERKKRKREK